MNSDYIWRNTLTIFFHGLIILGSYHAGKSYYPYFRQKNFKNKLPTAAKFVAVILSLIVIWIIACFVGIAVKSESFKSDIDYNIAWSWFLIFSIPYIFGFIKEGKTDDNLTEKERKDKYNSF